MILHCCHLGRGSARGLERVKSDPKGEDDRGEGERRKNKRALVYQNSNKNTSFDD